MTQTSILAPGNASDTSADIVVVPGAAVIVGIYAAVNSILPEGALFTVMQDTPGADNAIALLSSRQNAVALSGPGTFRVIRRAYAGEPFGVFVES